MSKHRVGAELKEQASEKVDEAKDKANDLANDAKKKGEEVKQDVQQKADEVKAKGEVHTSTTGTAHNVSASHDSNAPHGDSSAAKIEVKTTGTGKPPLV
ncbi:unnamed protein product [Adineta steineri]|uniref:Uncharacterized protein n=1 Tax=Adineta steineri TaxID=433720 RepID=A0A820PPD1_9BILA|nr:unnamed protein product [Adineta steineri]CAF4406219.1 unnamed protein product [Adineta steineri]